MSSGCALLTQESLRNRVITATFGRQFLAWWPGSHTWCFPGPLWSPGTGVLFPGLVQQPRVCPGLFLLIPQGDCLWIYTLPFANAPAPWVGAFAGWRFDTIPSPWKDIPLLALSASLCI